MKIIKIWFSADHIFGMDAGGKEYSQSLLWYPNLMTASDDERSQYTFGYDGIHWRNLDEDISFESFTYDDAEPSGNQRSRVRPFHWDERHAAAQLYKRFQEALSQEGK